MFRTLCIRLTNCLLALTIEIRAETAPKAGWCPTYLFTFLVYFSGILAFSLLYKYEAKKSTVETIIISYDSTGTDGYTCQMLSRVSASYQVPSAVDPSLAYYLVNVVESESQCQNDLQVADPCSLPLTYYPGVTSPLFNDLNVYGAVAMFSEDLLYIFDITSTHSEPIDKYDYTTGTFSSLEFNLAAGIFVDQSSMAMDCYGNAVFVMNVYSVKQIGSTGDGPVVELDFVWTDELLILNDNLYNMYLIAGQEFLTLDMYTQPGATTVLFDVGVNDTIVYAAVYHDGVSPLVYYTTESSKSTGFLYTFKDGVSTASSRLNLILNTHLHGMVVDGANNLYCLLFVQTLVSNGSKSLQFSSFECLSLYFSTELGIDIPDQFMILPVPPF